MSETAFTPKQKKKLSEKLLKLGGKLNKKEVSKFAEKYKGWDLNFSENKRKNASCFSENYKFEGHNTLPNSPLA